MSHLLVRVQQSRLRVLGLCIALLGPQHTILNLDETLIIMILLRHTCLSL